LLYSCVNRTVFEEYKEFDNLSWGRFDFVEFEVPIEDTDAEYDIFFAIRHLPEIPYKQMKINLTFHLPSDEMRTADHVFELVDEDGNKLSKCLGDLCDISFPVRKNFVFTEPGTVKFRIENKYTKTEMPGILEVGLIIKRSQKN
jgi:gliding motility-associated lipoprotein GldH